MFDTRVPLLPYWLAQMDNDAQKLPILPSKTPSVTQKNLKGKSKSASEVHSIHSDVTPRVRSLPNERSSLIGGGTSSGSQSYMGTFNNNNQYEERAVVDDESLPSKLVNNISTVFNQFIHHVNKSQQQQQQPQRQSDSVPVILPPGVKIPKKVVTPLRVEPKVFFANERTYFSWMSFGTLLSTFSLALFNAGDVVGKLSGIVYTLVSISTLMYGMGLYYRRRELIHNRAAGPYDELKGPTAICFALLFAVALNAYLKFTVKSPSLLYF